MGLEAYHSLYSIGFWKKPGAYGAGPFAFYSKGEPKNILLNVRKAPCKKQGELYIIEVTSPNSL